MITFYFLIKLFQLYERTEIFTLRNVTYIRNIGYAMLVKQLLNPVYQGLITGALTFNNPHGYRYATIGFGSTDLIAIVTALIIILVSWIMAEGCKLNDEQKYIV